jgi:hypothetical protein
MPDPLQFKLDIAKAVEDAFRKEGMELQLRQGFGDRLEGGEIARDLAIGTATNLLLTNVKRALLDRGVHVWGLTEEKNENIDFVFHVSGSQQSVRVGFSLAMRF